ncbi:unconventional myosin-IXa isoform X2 [Anabrus simplex]|uniref:unconventional myosin-IXa isoform X2 n=1 Tax=Anabrus simplex TaxID=316456 RepID=UPI0035A29CD2
MSGSTENNRHIVHVFVGALSQHYEALSVEASKQTTSEEIVSCILERLTLSDNSCENYELAEVVGDAVGQECKERRLGPTESPVAVMLLWPKTSDSQQEHYRFYLREKQNDSLWTDSFTMDPQLIRDYFYRFLYQLKDKEYPDLCQLPDLNEQTLLDNLRARFIGGHIYTYVGSILIAVNPFKFHPIYNPKYVKLYQNRRMGPELPPHIFAVADSAYHCMLKERHNQCIVISGESGSGKTESTNFLLHHLTALSQKGSHGSGVEQTILSAGPVLEAFGNAKTAHNNNSSRFGKFIQVNYKENGMVHGAVVQKYLLEKSRICSQGRHERNYHVFYYLLAGATETEKQILHLRKIEDYHYLSRSGCYTLDNVDEKYEFTRLKQSMEMVGFTAEKQRRLFAVLSAVLLLGNVEFQPRKSAYHHDEAVGVRNLEVVLLISELLRVKQETLLAALTAKRAKASGETLVINFRLPEAIAARDAMAKCLYGALFDWIVLQVNHALLSKKDTLRDHQGHSIGVLDIFGFEDFGIHNSFEQFCINYANEHLQYYFNQHVFKYEQEEYRKEGIRWKDIDFMDNTACLQLIEGKPSGLLCILDDQCNFPGATNETLLQKFNSVHKDNNFYEIPQRREAAFVVRHYAGKVKYQVAEMREKNLDLMRQDIVGVLKNSSMAFVRELVGADPVAVFRWAIVRAFFRGYFAFHEAGRRHRQGRDGNKSGTLQNRYRNHTPNESLIRKNKSFRPRERGKKSLKNLQTVKTLAGRTQSYSSGGQQVGKARKQPQTVTAQFQQSLHSLMDTLNQANPFFIRCIKSNGNKIPNKFDDDTVQRQLRYTGMLETVRIRQAGYNVRLTYDEFIQLYRILLPKGLVSSQADVRDFLLTLNLNRDNYQLGSSKIFLRESEKVKLDYRLHQQIMASIVTIQRWSRAILERRRFLRWREAAVVIQSHWRMFMAQRLLNHMRIRLSAVVLIQAVWRGHRCHLWYKKFRTGLVGFQAHVRGKIARRRYIEAREKRTKEIQGNLHANVEIPGHVLVRDEFLSKNENKENLGNHSTDKELLSSEILDDIDKRALQASKKNITAKTEHHENSSQEEKSSEVSSPNTLAVGERKGSNDSLTSQKSVESQRSTDSQSSAPVRETLHKKAKRQLQAFIGVGKKSEKWESGVAPLIHSDSEMEESNQLLSRSVLPDVLTAHHNRISGSEPPSADDVWYKRSNILLDQSEISVPKSSITRSPRVSQHVNSGDTPSDNRRVLKRELRTEVSTLSAEQKTRSPLKSSISHDEQYMTKPNIEPEIPVRIARRIRAPRELVCRSVGEEMTDSMTGDSNTNTGLLGTIRETNIVHEGGKSNETRSSWALRKEPRSSDGSESSYSGQFSSQESEWSHVPPHLDNVYLKSGIPIHGVPTKRNRSGAITSLHLKRRNSDPATKTMNLIMDQPMAGESPNSKPSDVLEWKSAQVFTIAGHHFRKVTRVSKEDRCIFCKNIVDAFVETGHKCTDCKQLFHTKCIQNGGVLQLPCSQQLQGSGKPGRRKHRKHSRTPYDMSKPTAGGKFSLTGTSEFTDSTDKIISDASELQQMQDFITQKIYKIESEEGKKPSEVDRVFKQALREFKDNLVSTYSVINKQGETFNIKYKDLIANFLHVMETVCNQEETKEAFPVTMGVNAFRGFMNEFMNLNRLEDKPHKTKRKKEKKRKTEDPIIFLGHTFLFSMINIPTACEVCSSFFMWPIEKSLICQNCKLTCHKKCYIRVTTPCGKDNMGGGNHVFGVPLHLLAVGDGKVPVVVDRLITTIEMYGLYTEGIYRKSGVTSKVKELKTRIEEGNIDEVNFENYHVHVLAAVLKSFVREMPEPLLTFDSYEDFLRAASLTDPQDRISTLFAILKKLPKPNFDLMERLIFHLARVALHEDANRMNASALAIVFAPCILRTNKIVPAQDSLHDIGRQTQCVETIITEKLRKVRATLADIDTLDTACHTATHRLSSLRSSKIFSPDELLPAELTNSDAKPALLNADDEEALLVGHIQEIQKEKALLTSALPSLTRTTSDDDLLSTDMDDGSLDDVTGHIDENDQEAQQYSIQQGRKGKVHRTLAMRSISGGDEPNCEDASNSSKRKLKRQSSADNSTVSLYPPLEDEDPIMV